MKTNVLLFLKSFYDKLDRDRIYAYSATAAFFMILSIFPFLILMLTIVQYTPLTQEFLLERLPYVIPDALIPLITEIIDEIFNNTLGATLIFVSAFGAIWSASKGIMALIRGVNVCFNINDKRNYFLVRFLSSIYTVIFLIGTIFILVLLVFGTTIYRSFKDKIGTLNKVIRFILDQRILISIIVLMLLFMLVYKFLPAKQNRFLRMLPGALIAALCWVGLSSLISLYVKYFPNFTYTYGSLTSFILLMLWLYFGMYILFICAEINYYINIGFEMRARRKNREKALKHN